MPDTSDTYDLPPTQALAMEVLAARWRLGEAAWAFSGRPRPALEALSRRGLAAWRPGIGRGTITAWLTPDGLKTVLSGTYETPALRLLKEAHHLRQHGDRAPGSRENWADWDRKAGAFLRAMQPPTREDNRT